VSGQVSEFLTPDETATLHHLVNKSLGLSEGCFYHAHLGTLLIIAVGMAIDDELLWQAEDVADAVTAYEEQEVH
jgi:hypothetical protein